MCCDRGKQPLRARPALAGHATRRHGRQKRPGGPCGGWRTNPTDAGEVHALPTLPTSRPEKPAVWPRRTSPPAKARGFRREQGSRRNRRAAAPRRQRTPIPAPTSFEKTGEATGGWSNRRFVHLEGVRARGAVGKARTRRAVHIGRCGQGLCPRRARAPSTSRAPARPQAGCGERRGAAKPP